MSPYILARMAAFIQGQKYKVEPQLVASQAQLVMPLAAMVPLGIITVAIGLAGLGMGGVHYVFQGEVLQTVLMTPVLELAEDPVPNIRFNVCKTLQKLVPHVDSATVTTRIKPVLTVLQGDVDRDVKFYAGEALAVC